MIQAGKLKIPKSAVSAIVVLWLVTLSTVAYLFVIAEEQIANRNRTETERAKTNAYLIAQHFQHGFETADFLLRSAVDMYRVTTKDGALSEKRKEDLRAYLKDQAKLLPGVASFTIIRPNGRRLVGIVNKDDTDLSERPYFIAIRDVGHEAYISSVESGLASGKNGIHFARMIPDSNGRFNGVVVINLAAKDTFYDYLHALELNGSSLQLRTPNKLYLSYPETTVTDRDVEKSIIDKLHEGSAEPNYRQSVIKNNGGTIIINRLLDTDLYAVLIGPSSNGADGEGFYIPLSYTIAAGILLGAIFSSILLVNWYKLKDVYRKEMSRSAERKLLIKKLHSIAEDERKTIAHDIHDVMNATLIAIKYDAHAIKQKSKDPVRLGVAEYINERATAIEVSAKELYAYCRAIVSRLRPEALDIHGIEGAALALVEGFNARNKGCVAIVESRGDWQHASNETTLALFRIIQESLSNIQKYAKATRVELTLSVDEDRSTANLSVQDNGIGLQPNAKFGYGLLGIKERAASLGGECDVSSEPGAGVCINISIPLNPELA